MERKRSPKIPHCDRGHAPRTGSMGQAPLLIDTCQSPLTAALGSAQSVPTSWVMPTLGADCCPPGRGQGHCHPANEQILHPVVACPQAGPCSHQPQWPLEQGRAEPCQGVLAAGAEGSPVLTPALTQGVCRGTMCPPSAPQIPDLPCPLLGASQRPRPPSPCSHLFP